MTITTQLLRASAIAIALFTLSSCGQKGPLILEEIPVDKTQQPLENSLDDIPVETDVKDEENADTGAE